MPVWSYCNKPRVLIAYMFRNLFYEVSVCSFDVVGADVQGPSDDCCAEALEGFEESVLPYKRHFAFFDGGHVRVPPSDRVAEEKARIGSLRSLP